MSASAQRLLAAHLMTAPNLVLEMNIKPSRFTDKVSGLVVKILREQGALYAAPNAMVSAIEETDGVVVTPEEVREVLELMPMETARYADIETLLKRIDAQTMSDRAVKNLSSIVDAVREGKITYEEAVERIDAGKLEYRSYADYDTSANAILDAMANGQINVRWPLSERFSLLDMGFHGVDKNDEPVQAIVAQGEFGMITAPYKVGKTREALAMIGDGGPDLSAQTGGLLDRGATVGYILLEDTATKLTAKLIGQRYDIEFWKVLLHLRGKYRNTDEAQFEHDVERIETGVRWLRKISPQWHVFDALHPQYNVYNWKDVQEITALMKHKHGAQVIVIDYFQQFSEDYDVLKELFLDARRLAARHNVALIGLSQMSNDVIKNGSQEGMLSTKGAGNAGAAVHWGLELTGTYDEFGRRTPETKVALKIARDSEPRTLYQTNVHKTGYLRNIGELPEFAAKPAATKKK